MNFLISYELIKIKNSTFCEIFNINDCLKIFSVRKYTCPFTFTDVSWSSVNREKDSGKLIDCVKLIVGPIFDQFSPIFAQKFIFNVNLNFEVLIILLENSIKQVIMIFWMFQNRHLKKKSNLRSFISQKFTIQTLGVVQSNFNFCKMLLNIWKKTSRNGKLRKKNMMNTRQWFLRNLVHQKMIFVL